MLPATLILLQALLCTADVPTTAPSDLLLPTTTGPLREFVVLKVDDLDDITVKCGDQTLVVAMANTLPFKAWPNNLAGECRATRAAAIPAIEAELKRAPVWIGLYKEASKPGGVPWVMISRRDGQEWDPNTPAGRGGWFITNLNLWVIQSGYSPPVLHAPTLRYAGLQRSAGPQDAWGFAKEHAAGFFFKYDQKAGILEAEAKSRSDHAPLALDGLDDASLLGVAKVLLESPDQSVRVSAARALGMQGRGLRDDDPLNQGIAAAIIHAYGKNDDPLVKFEFLRAIALGHDESPTAMDFARSVAAKETDPEIKHEAENLANKKPRPQASLSTTRPSP